MGLGYEGHTLNLIFAAMISIRHLFKTKDPDTWYDYALSFLLANQPILLLAHLFFFIITSQRQPKPATYFNNTISQLHHLEQQSSVGTWSKFQLVAGGSFTIT